jgi:hypothetical protein
VSRYIHTLMLSEVCVLRKRQNHESTAGGGKP